MTEEIEKVVPTTLNNKVTIKVPFTTADIGVISEAMKIEEIGNYDKDSEMLDNGLMTYDKESGLWSLQRTIYVDSIANEDGFVRIDGTVSVTDMNINGSSIVDFISDNVKQIEVEYRAGDGIELKELVDTETNSTYKEISLMGIDGLEGGTVGSASKIPVITYDNYGRILAVSEVPVSTSGETTSTEHTHSDLYYTKDEVNALIQAAMSTN